MSRGSSSAERSSRAGQESKEARVLVRVPSRKSDAGRGKGGGRRQRDGGAAREGCRIAVRVSAVQCEYAASETDLALAEEGSDLRRGDARVGGRVGAQFASEVSVGQHRRVPESSSSPCSTAQRVRESESERDERGRRRASARRQRPRPANNTLASSPYGLRCTLQPVTGVEYIRSSERPERAESTGEWERRREFSKAALAPCAPASARRQLLCGGNVES